MPNRNVLLLAAVTIIFPGHALAQEVFSVDWHTVDCGGGSSNGDEFDLEATIAQPDAGDMTGPPSVDAFSLAGGFWTLANTGACYPNCDNSTSPPILNSNDFQCFLNRYASGDSYANCDGSTNNPILNANDFQCFLNAFAAGCS
jgi:hypothetical protein